MKFMTDRKSPNPCEGALLCLIALCEALPQLTEGVAVDMLPAILPCFADRAAPVKEAVLKLAQIEMKM